jgi:hypothetical protein
MVLVTVHITVRARCENHNPIVVVEQNARDALETASHPRDTCAVLTEWSWPSQCELPIIDREVRSSVLIVEATLRGVRE